MKCWVCETEMKLIEIKNFKTVTGKDFVEYKCFKCGEIVYRPLEMIRDLTTEEEEACYNALYNMSEDTGMKLF